MKPVKKGPCMKPGRHMSWAVKGTERYLDKQDQRKRATCIEPTSTCKKICKEEGHKHRAYEYM